jgi:hypothetical protein
MADINDTLDDISRIATKLHGAGCGFNYKHDKPAIAATATTEAMPASHTLVVYHSTFRTGNTNVIKQTGISYEDVVEKTHVKLKELERAYDEKKKQGPALNALQYCYSLEEAGHYYGPFDSVGEAIVAARAAHRKVKTFWLGHCQYPNIDTLTDGMGHTLIESMRDCARDNFSTEAAEDWLDGVSDKDASILADRVQKILKDWLAATDELPRFFRVVDAYQYSVSTNGERAAT